MKKFFLNIAISLVGIIFAAILLEIGYRALTSVAAPAPEWSDRPTVYYVPKGAETLRDKPYSPKKDSGVFRIAVIGDSFSFGPYLQFDDTFPKRLERWLNLNNSEKRVEVINYGVPRYSTSHEVGLAKKALEEQADLVLLQITLNDPEIKPYHPTQLIQNDRFGQPKLEGGVFHYWKSLAFLVTRYYNMKSVEDYKDYFLKLFSKKENWDSFSNSVRKIESLCSEKRVPLVAVVFPLFGLPADDSYPFYEIHKKIKELLDSLEVKNLDLLSTYRDIPLDRLVVLPGKDRHPNEIGHRIAAEGILDWFNKEGIIPQDLFPSVTVKERIGIKIGSSIQNSD